MFGFIVVFIFILFFVLMIVVKDKNRLLKIIKVFLIFILGGLVIAGGGSIVSGMLETFQGKMDAAQALLQIIMGFLFIAVGGIPLYLYFISRAVDIRKLERRKKKYPDAPWMWVDHWSTKSIAYSGKGPISFGWFVLLVMTASLGAVSYVNRGKILSKLEGSGFEVIAFYSVFCLILLVGFYTLISLLRGYLKFGKSIFEMSTYPGIIGDKLVGRIQTHMREIPEKGFDLELECGLIDLTSQAGRQLRNPEMTKRIWDANKNVRLQEVSLGPAGVSIPVSFSISAGVPESDAWSPDKRIKWTLSAFASVKGAQYLSQFDVPVFNTRQKT
ncbi:MAG: hypothetical protein A2V65_03820 [Deltaproteobacteria bacterium RBG_13_49_15]|nr:MAG: hypothetical protein A2V65_03820 [Deltaproteobacteria bacterium RBG_13_49_15]